MRFDSPDSQGKPQGEETINLIHALLSIAIMTSTEIRPKIFRGTCLIPRSLEYSGRSIEASFMHSDLLHCLISMSYDRPSWTRLIKQSITRSQTSRLFHSTCRLTGHNMAIVEQEFDAAGVELA